MAARMEANDPVQELRQALQDLAGPTRLFINDTTSTTSVLDALVPAALRARPSLQPAFERAGWSGHQFRGPLSRAQLHQLLVSMEVCALFVYELLIRFFDKHSSLH